MRPLLAGLCILLMGVQPKVAQAQEVTACSEVAGILTEAVAEWPNLLSTARIKPRMAVVRIGTSAGVAVRYAMDAGWSGADLMPIEALRDTREQGAGEPELTKDRAPALLHGHLMAIETVLHAKCPDTELPDISGLSTLYPES